MEISTNPVDILFRKWLRLTRDFLKLTGRIFLGIWVSQTKNQVLDVTGVNLRHDKLLKGAISYFWATTELLPRWQTILTALEQHVWNLVRPLGWHRGRGLGLDFFLNDCSKKTVIAGWFLKLLSVIRCIRLISSYRRKRILNWKD